jgi:hypothetical protein
MLSLAGGGLLREVTDRPEVRSMACLAMDLAVEDSIVNQKVLTGDAAFFSTSRILPLHRTPERCIFLLQPEYLVFCSFQ